MSNHTSGSENPKNYELTNTENNMNFDEFITSLRLQDEKAEKQMKNFKWIYIVLVIFYTGLMIVNPDPDLQIHHRISGAFYVVAFVLFAIFFKKSYDEIHSVDYSISMKELLQKAAIRYKSAFKNLYRIILPLLLLDAGITLSFYHRLSSMSPAERIVYVQLVYVAIMAGAAYIGHRMFMKKQYPISQQARKLLDELEIG